MTDTELIAALQHDLAFMAVDIKRLERELAAAKETIAAIVRLNTELEQRVEGMRQIAVANASNTDKQLRIAAGEKE